MSGATSTARSWRGAHEASRARMESLCTRTEAFETVARQLRESRKIWRKTGPQARTFLKSHPLLTQHQAIRKFYLSEGSDKGEVLLTRGLRQQQFLLERNIAFGIKSFIAASRSSLALRLSADRLCLSAKDALYVNEAVTEQPSELAFEQACAGSVFGSISRPSLFHAKAQVKPPVRALAAAIRGRAGLCIVFCVLQSRVEACWSVILYVLRKSMLLSWPSCKEKATLLPTLVPTANE